MDKPIPPTMNIAGKRLAGQRTEPRPGNRRLKLVKWQARKKEQTGQLICRNTIWVLAISVQLTKDLILTDLILAGPSMSPGKTSTLASSGKIKCPIIRMSRFPALESPVFSLTRICLLNWALKCNRTSNTKINFASKWNPRLFSIKACLTLHWKLLRSIHYLKKMKKSCIPLKRPQPSRKILFLHRAQICIRQKVWGMRFKWSTMLNRISSNSNPVLKTSRRWPKRSLKKKRNKEPKERAKAVWINMWLK